MNGFWKRIVMIAAAVITLAGAYAVIETWAPWAPRVTLVMAAENSLDRLTTKLLTFQSLARRTKDVNEKRRLLVLIAETKRHIDRVIALRKLYK